MTIRSPVTVLVARTLLTSALERAANHPKPPDIRKSVRAAHRTATRTERQSDSGALVTDMTRGLTRRVWIMDILDSRPDLCAPASLLSEIQQLAAAVPGDAAPDTLFALAMLLSGAPAAEGHIVHVGAGQGRASAVLGSCARQIGRARVFAVDLFPDGEDVPDNTGWTLDAFLAMLAGYSLLEHVLPHHGTAATFTQLMPSDFRCRMIYLEGAHACRDVTLDLVGLDRLLVPGGWMCIDAGFGSFPGADAAMQTLWQQRPHFDLVQQFTPTLTCARKRI